MPGVVRRTDLCSGHGCWPPRPPATWSPDVICENLNVERRIIDHMIPHCCGPCHSGVYMGVNTVLANNQPMQKKTDPISCGSRCMECSGTVFLHEYGGITV